MEKKFLIFKFDDEYFAIDLKCTREIINYIEPTPVHSMPDFFLGLIHLRGFFLPLIDIRSLLSMPPKQAGGDIKKYRTVIISIFRKIVGIKIEDVEDIMAIDESKILPPPGVLKTQASNYISGGFYVNDRVMLIVDFEKLFVEAIMPHKINLPQKDDSF